MSARVLSVFGPALAGLLVLLAAAAATLPGRTQGVAETCGASALGVSRTIEIDTAGGPRFGQQQYPEGALLGDKEVILTFDDGPMRQYTKPVLDALAAHCTKATFFMVGRMAIADPQLAQEVMRRGHTVGTHTWSHRNLRTTGAAAAQTEVELGFSAVQRALGKPPAPFFRFPYLADQRAMLKHTQDRHMGVFSIDVDSYDYRTFDPAIVRQNILRQLVPKGRGILLFHDIQPSTALALPGVLADLKARGFRVVHMVPKGKIETLPDFDRVAEKALKEKRLAAVGQPLADRSLVWPLASVKPVPGVGLTTPPLADPAEAVPAKPQPVRRGPEEPWYNKIFQN